MSYNITIISQSHHTDISTYLLNKYADYKEPGKSAFATIVPLHEKSTLWELIWIFIFIILELWLFLVLYTAVVIFYI